MIFSSILDTVGRTPVVKLSKVEELTGFRIFVKLESANPGGSIKDRAALAMITQAERDGRLKPNGTIVESTSGNLGKSLALIGAVKGYRVVIVVDPKAPSSVIRFASSLGADIEMVSTPDENGGFQKPRLERVRQLVATIPDAFCPDQYNNPANPRAHATATATELLADVPEFEALITAVSTGGHLSGLAATVKQQLPDTVTIGVDAEGSGAFGYPPGKYAMRGLGLAWPPGNLDRSLIDRLHRVADSEGISTMRLLARAEGILVGESGGAAVFAALHHAHHHPGHRIVVVAADGSANYLDDSFGADAQRPSATDGRAALVDLVTAAKDPRHGQVLLGSESPHVRKA